MAGPVADASYSGAPATVPAAMLDGDPATGWSNYYSKQATQTLPTVSRSPRAGKVPWQGNRARRRWRHPPAAG